MSGPRLTREQRDKLYRPLHQRVLADLTATGKGAPEILWALRRKLARDLTYMERSTPAARKKLKARMFAKQNGRCALCGKQMIQRGAELDRFNPYDSYVENNVRLVHHDCHIADQECKHYS
jgi:hypothetical protein